MPHGCQIPVFLMLTNDCILYGTRNCSECANRSGAYEYSSQRAEWKYVQLNAGIKKTEIGSEGPFLSVSYAAKQPEGLFLKGQIPVSVAVTFRFGPKKLSVCLPCHVSSGDDVRRGRRRGRG